MMRHLILCMALLAASAASPARSLVLTNCGQQWHFDRVPERTIVYSHSTLENLLALGLGSSIISVVGYSKEQDIAPSPWTAAAKLKARFDSAPWSGEALLAAQPDFIYSGSFYWFNSPETPNRHRLAGWGIATWLSESVCHGLQSGLQTPLTFAGIFAEVRNIARIYGVQPRAENLIQQLQRQVDAERQKARQLPAQRILWWYSGIGTPYVAGSHGAPALLTDAIGSRNVFADSPELWPAMSWEVIAERDPDLLIIGDLRRAQPGDSAQEKIAFLENNPLTAGMKAVREKRYIILPGYDMDPSVRSILALKRLVSQMRSLTEEDENGFSSP